MSESPEPRPAVVAGITAGVPGSLDSATPAELAQAIEIMRPGSDAAAECANLADEFPVCSGCTAILRLLAALLAERQAVTP
jgi:hypothetical protein